MNKIYNQKILQVSFESNYLHMQVLQKYIAKTIQWFRNIHGMPIITEFIAVVPQNVHQTKICDNIIL